LAVVFTLLGALALIMGWVGTSGTGHVAKQLPYIMSGGIAGIVLVAMGAVLWLSADLRDEWRELRRLRLQLALDAVPGKPHRVSPMADPIAMEDDTGPQELVAARRQRARRRAAPPAP
jgi:hypothetical protein